MNVVALFVLGLGFTAGVLFTTLNTTHISEVPNDKAEEINDTLKVESGDALEKKAEFINGLFVF
ncbi:MAG: hypothetical protein CVU09_07965 [Bacteroidetes bacterium HGW-Bacteroidetes-4]|jgi:hypothetical protein|nr:MAG: hypothetical protein CVU09_07965 [Bacteroidetes bacterium HGW-Bacteroidetes-4]